MGIIFTFSFGNNFHPRDGEMNYRSQQVCQHPKDHKDWDTKHFSLVWSFRKVILFIFGCFFWFASERLLRSVTVAVESLKFDSLL